MFLERLGHFVPEADIMPESQAYLPKLRARIELMRRRRAKERKAVLDYFLQATKKLLTSRLVELDSWNKYRKQEYFNIAVVKQQVTSRLPR
jgi:hypothetical protein